MNAADAQDLVELFAGPPVDFAYHTDDAITEIRNAPLGCWIQLLAQWAARTSEWKTNVGGIIDKLDAPRLLALLEELASSTDELDMHIAVNIVSQIDSTDLSPKLRASTIELLNRAWEMFPNSRNHIRVSAKACGLEFVPRKHA